MARHIGAFVLAAAGAACFGVITAGSALAADQAAQQLPTQDQTEADPSRNANLPSANTNLEEVIVTARRREEVLQDVPVAITSLNVSQLQATGVADLDMLQQVAPGLDVEQQRDRNSTLPGIRGVKSSEISPDAQKVETLFDGLPVLGQQSVTQFVDLERVEVYRGPQEAEFGRSVFAGAINYISTPANLTRDQGFGDVTYGTDGLASGEALFTGPIVPGKLGLLISVHQDNYDGPGNFNGVPGTITAPDGAGHLGGTSTRYMSVKLAYQPADWIQVELRYQHLDTDDEPGDEYNLDENGSQFTFLPGANPLTTSPIVRGAVNFTPSSTAFDRIWCFTGNTYDPTPTCLDQPSNRLNRNRYTAGVTLDTGRGSSLSVRTYSSWEYQTRQDDSGYNSVLPYLNTVTDTAVNPLQLEYDSLPESEHYGEIVWLSPADARLRGSVGVSYYWYDFGTTIYFDSAVAQIFSDDTRNKATYGSIQYDLTSALTLNAEARWQADTVVGYNNSASPAIEVSTTTDSFLPRFTALYKINPNLSFYAQAAKGVDPGGNNADVVTPLKQEIAAAAGTTSALDSFLHYQQETLWNYEIGAKGAAFDNRLSFSADIYMLDWYDYQNVTNYTIAAMGSFPTLSTVGGNYTTRATFNEGTVHGKGVELNGVYQPISMLGINFSYSHDETWYANDCSPSITFYGLPLERTTPYPCVNVDGHQLPEDPVDSLGLGLTLTTPLGPGRTWTNRLLGYYLGKQFLDDTNLDWIAPKTTLNFISSVTQGRAVFTFFVNNLTDNRTPTAADIGPPPASDLYEYSNFNLKAPGSEMGAITATVAPPREYGVTGEYRF